VCPTGVQRIIHLFRREQWVRMDGARVSVMRCATSAIPMPNNFCLGHGSLICVVVRHLDRMIGIVYGPITMEGHFVMQMCRVEKGQSMTCCEKNVSPSTLNNNNNIVNMTMTALLACDLRLVAKEKSSSTIRHQLSMTSGHPNKYDSH
jgi:hypothetical protein